MFSSSYAQFNSAILQRGKLLVFACFIFCSVCSCISRQKAIYLQDNMADDLYTNASLKNMPLQHSAYRLQPADRLLVYFFSLTDEKYNFLKKPEVEVMIHENGNILIPVIGSVAIGGLTINEAEERLKKVSSQYLRNPEITIKLLNFNITLLGEVVKQGNYNISESKANVLNAIGHAGGLTENANMANIRIIRKENDSAKIFSVNMLEDNLLCSEEFLIKPNDIILVNPLKERSKSQALPIMGFVLSIASTLVWIFKR